VTDALATLSFFFTLIVRTLFFTPIIRTLIFSLLFCGSIDSMSVSVALEAQFACITL
jgi:hypothetical protein